MNEFYESLENIQDLNKELIESAQNGSNSAMEKLVENNQRLIWR